MAPESKQDNTELEEEMEMMRVEMGQTRIALNSLTTSIVQTQAFLAKLTQALERMSSIDTLRSL